MKRKKLLSIIAIIALLALIAVCTWILISKSHVKEAANSAIDTLNKEHYEGLNSFFADGNSLDNLAEADPEIAALGFGSAESEAADYSLFNTLLINADVKLKSVNPFSKTVTLSVTNADFSTFFSDNRDAACESESDLIDLILSYADTHQQITSVITLPYEKTDSGITIDFNSREFINAYLGGFMQSYSDEYYAGIETILEGGD